MEELESGREDCEERDQFMSKLSEYETQIQDLDKQLSRFTDFDPDAVEKMKQQTKTACECANRWTDNVFTCQSWAVSKFGMDKRDFCRQFEIPEDLDYIDA